MCHINVIINKNKKETELLTSVINAMTYSSYKSNKDGDGALLFSKTKMSIVKNTSKIKYNGKYNMIISHQRYATGGKKDVLNAHPHIGKRFICIHNGVFSYLGDNEKSDSIHFLDDLEKAVGDEEKIYDKVKEYLSTISGTFSVFLYDKLYKKIYYFKEYSTNFYFSENDEWLIMSTSKENVDYGRFILDVEKEPQQLKEYVIWEVERDGNFIKLGDFKKKEVEYKSYYGNTSTLSKYTNTKSYEEICEENKDIIELALSYISSED